MVPAMRFRLPCGRLQHMHIGVGLFHCYAYPLESLGDKEMDAWAKVLVRPLNENFEATPKESIRIG